jgi:hypothetical protein
MPMPYSHYVLAQRIAADGNLPITTPPDYYLGAFLPDIRYFTKLPREKYHFPVHELERYQHHSDVTIDFLLGYKVHLLIDEVWEDPEIKSVYLQAFPAFLRTRLTRGLQALAFKMYCLQQPVERIQLKPVENTLTRQLEMKDADIAWAVASMQRYLEHHDLAAALEMAKETQLFPEARLRTVEQVVAKMRNSAVRAVAYLMINHASKKVFSRVETKVLQQLKQSAKRPASTHD